MNISDPNGPQVIEQQLPPYERSRRHFKGKKTMAAIVAVLLLILGLAWFIFLYDPVSPLDTVELSNGKKISLRQSVKSLEETLAGDLEKNTQEPGHYLYPAQVRNGRLAAEVSIFTDKKKVTAIRFVRLATNKQQQTGAHLRMSVSDLAASFPKPLKQIDEKAAGEGRAKGFRNQNAYRSASYYLVDPCGDAETITAIIVTLKSAEKKAIAAGAGCNLRGN